MQSRRAVKLLFSMDRTLERIDQRFAAAALSPSPKSTIAPRVPVLGTAPYKMRPVDEAGS